MTSHDSTASVSLPPDGTIVRVSPWRHYALWAPVFIYIAFTIFGPIYALNRGKPAASVFSVVFAFLVIVSVRMARSGVMLAKDGVTGRTTWRTYRWAWEDIERFELRKRGEVPRFQIHLKSGRSYGFRGFFARTPEEEARGAALLKALEERLESEQTRRADTEPDQVSRRLS